MAYIIGLMSEDEANFLKSCHWELEDPPKELIDPEAKEKLYMVFINEDMFNIIEQISPQCKCDECGSQSTHSHHGSLYCDDCWDERLRITE